MPREWTSTQRRWLMEGYKNGKTASQLARELGPSYTINMVLSQIHHLKNRIKDSPYKDYDCPEKTNMWSLDEDRRREAIARKASEGARAAIDAIRAERL